jgi:hypothetical protein
MSKGKQKRKRQSKGSKREKEEKRFSFVHRQKGPRLQRVHKYNSDRVNNGRVKPRLSFPQLHNTPKWTYQSWDAKEKWEQREEMATEGTKATGWFGWLVGWREGKRTQGGPFTHVVPWLYNPLKKREVTERDQTDREWWSEQCSASSTLHSFPNLLSPRSLPER